MLARSIARPISWAAAALVAAAWCGSLYRNVFGPSAAPLSLAPESVMQTGMWVVVLPASWMAFSLIGGMIVRARPRNTVGWLCICFGVLGALEDIQWQIARLIAEPVPQWILAGLAQLVLALYLPTTLTLLLLRFRTAGIARRSGVMLNAWYGSLRCCRRVSGSLPHVYGLAMNTLFRMR